MKVNPKFLSEKSFDSNTFVIKVPKVKLTSETTDWVNHYGLKSKVKGMFVEYELTEEHDLESMFNTLNYDYLFHSVYLNDIQSIKHNLQMYYIKFLRGIGVINNVFLSLDKGRFPASDIMLTSLLDDISVLQLQVDMLFTETYSSGIPVTTVFPNTVRKETFYGPIINFITIEGVEFNLDNLYHNYERLKFISKDFSTGLITHYRYFNFVKNFFNTEFLAIGDVIDYSRLYIRKRKHGIIISNNSLRAVLLCLVNKYNYSIEVANSVFIGTIFNTDIRLNKTFSRYSFDIQSFRSNKGLYIHYVIDKMKELGEDIDSDTFSLTIMKYAEINSRYTLDPSTFLNELFSLAKYINKNYTINKSTKGLSNHIKDLVLGARKLGLLV